MLLLLSLILTLTLVRLAFCLLLSFLWEAYRDCFHVFLSLCVCFCFPPASHVEGLSLTTSLRYQDLRFFFIIS
jgi:hypothetical protein